LRGVFHTPFSKGGEATEVISGLEIGGRELSGRAVDGIGGGKDRDNLPLT
jgi:hypothetical protein